MAGGENRRDKVLDLLSCYLETRKRPARGDYSGAIAMLHELESKGRPEFAEPTPPENRKTPLLPLQPAPPQALPVDASPPPAPKALHEEELSSPPSMKEEASSPPRSAESRVSTRRRRRHDFDSRTSEYNVGAMPPREARRAANSGGDCKGCGMPAKKSSVRNCTSCSVDICPSCGEYARVHSQSHVFYKYDFNYPLCKDCYLLAYRTQEEIGRASTYFGMGNLTYAAKHASKAVDIARSWEGGEAYLDKANRLSDLVSQSKHKKMGQSAKAKKGRERKETSMEFQGDKWTKRFIERALANKEE